MSTISCPIDKTIVKRIIQNATAHKMNVCIIDVTNPDLNRKFRRNFNEFYEVVDDDGEELDTIMLYKDSGLTN